MLHDVRDPRELVTAEAEQLRDSGYEVGDLLEKAKAAASDANYGLLQDIAQQLERLERAPGWGYQEPDDEATIAVLASLLPQLEVNEDELESRVTGAWLGRCVG